MRILLVEDFVHKRERLCAALRHHVGDTLELRSAASVQSAIHALTEERFDVVVLDMSLPVFEYSPVEDGFTHLSFGGRDILDHVSRQVPATPVIVVTAFERFGETEDAMTLEELDRDLRTEFPEVYRGSVWYRDIEQQWERDLAGFLLDITKGS
jgi:CheY-like chemotaxis protein